MEPSSRIRSFPNASSPSILETLFAATYSSSSASAGPGFVASRESGPRDLISLYDSSRRRSDVKGERFGIVVSLLSWKTSSSRVGAEADCAMREASARRFWRRESLRRSVVFEREFFEFFFFDRVFFFSLSYFRKERERERGRRGEFFHDRATQKKRCEIKTTLTWERQEPVVELLEAVGGEVDGLRRKKGREKKRKKKKKRRRRKKRERRG